MKRATAAAVAVAMSVVLAGGALAGTVVVGRGLYESRGGYKDGELYVTPTGVPGYPDGVAIGTFCVELSEPITINGTYNAAVNTVAIKGSAAVSDPLGPKTAWLYYQYYVGNIVIDTGAKATDFQYAIWKLEDEDTQAPSEWATVTWTAEAEAYYQAALASSWTDIGPVRLLNLTTASGERAQDTLVVPEPATIALMGLGGAALLLTRRRRV